MNLSPIILFVYNRPWHTQQTIKALQDNELAKESDLFIFADGPKTSAANGPSRAVREYIRTVTGFKSITINERETNLGLANSIVDGVTRLCKEYGRVIVLEDDLVVSPYFLNYMNQGLNLYAAEDEVISISGYMDPIKAKLPETFFLRGPDSWGWGTWKRGWDLFEPDGKKLLSEVRKGNLTREFDFNGAYAFTQMLEDQIQGKIDSWAIRWYASAFLKDKLTLFPGRSLVQNIGHDGSGTHCGKTDVFGVEVMNTPLSMKRVPIEENIAAQKAMERFMRNLQPKPPFFRRIKKKIKKLLKRRAIH